MFLADGITSMNNPLIITVILLFVSDRFYCISYSMAKKQHQQGLAIAYMLKLHLEKSLMQHLCASSLVNRDCCLLQFVTYNLKLLLFFQSSPKEVVCETCSLLSTGIEVDHMLLLAADNGCFNCLTTLIKTGPM